METQDPLDRFSGTDRSETRRFHLDVETPVEVKQLQPGAEGVAAAAVVDEYVELDGLVVFRNAVAVADGVPQRLVVDFNGRDFQTRRAQAGDPDPMLSLLGVEAALLPGFDENGRHAVGRSKACLDRHHYGSVAVRLDFPQFPGLV